MRCLEKINNWQGIKYAKIEDGKVKIHGNGYVGRRLLIRMFECVGDGKMTNVMLAYDYIKKIGMDEGHKLIGHIVGQMAFPMLQWRKLKFETIEDGRVKIQANGKIDDRELRKDKYANVIDEIGDDYVILKRNVNIGFRWKMFLDKNYRYSWESLTRHINFDEISLKELLMMEEKYPIRIRSAKWKMFEKEVK